MKNLSTAFLLIAGLFISSPSVASEISSNSDIKIDIAKEIKTNLALEQIEYRSVENRMGKPLLRPVFLGREMVQITLTSKYTDTSKLPSFPQAVKSIPVSKLRVSNDNIFEKTPVDKVWLTLGTPTAIPAYQVATIYGFNYYHEETGELLWKRNLTN